MAVDMRWLTAGEDEEDIELRHAELGTWFDCGGFDAAQAHADLAEMARLSERYGGWVSVGRTLHGSGAIVEKRYDLQHGRGGDAGWVEDITARVLADGQG
jgi:hypothetical protein